MVNEQAVLSSMLMDRSEALGNTPPPSDPDGRRRLSVKVANELSEAIPVFFETSGGGVALNIYDSQPVVLSGVETLIVSYTVPVGYTAQLLRVEFAGDNIARYQVFKNAAVIATQRTYFGGAISGEFDFFAGGINGLPLASGDLIQLKVLQIRPSSGSFEARIQVNEVAP